MRLLLDENVPFPFQALLVGLGHDVKLLADHDRGLADEEVARLASSEGRVLVTQDLDLGGSSSFMAEVRSPSPFCASPASP